MEGRDGSAAVSLGYMDLLYLLADIAHFVLAIAPHSRSFL